MIRYQVYYYHTSDDHSTASPMIAVVNALTEQSAQAKFLQMYHDCRIIEIKEIKDEG